MKRALWSALLVVLALAAASPHAFAQRLACSTIQPGETAARVARRVTGDPRNRHQPWFQIVDPTDSRFIAKGQYDRIRAGWLACIVNEPAENAIDRGAGGSDLTPVLWGGLVVVIALVWRSVDEYLADRQARLDAMKRFGETFVREFERPLLQQPLRERPLQSRLRVSPHRQRLDVLLAPSGGRRYPNLADHRKNVAYDVTRVLQQVRDQAFVCGPLYAQGPWVVVPFQFQVSSTQAGGK